jgi:hypothetical protein
MQALEIIQKSKVLLKSIKLMQCYRLILKRVLKSDLVKTFIIIISLLLQSTAGHNLLQCLAISRKLIEV